MRKFAIAAQIVLLLTSLVAKGQESTSDTLSSFVSRDLSAFWRDAGYIFSAPVRFDGTDWATTAIVAGGTALTFTVDDPVRDIAKRNQSPTADHIALLGKAYGDNLNVLILCSGVYAGGLVFGSEHVRSTGRMMFESALFAGLYTSVIKSVLGRSRPYLEEGPYRFRFFEFNNEHLSLPSGHVTLAFSISSVLAERIHNTYASILLYSLASLTAYSRVHSDEHWISDTLLGAAIGTSVGLAVANPRRADASGSSLHFSPLPMGVRVDLVF